MAKSILISRGCEPAALALIPKDVEVDLNGSEEALSRTELMTRLKGRQGLICQITATLARAVLPPPPAPRCVANTAGGNNNIDGGAAGGGNGVVTNPPDVLPEPPADFAWALLMAAARRVVEADAYARSGQWK